MCFEAPTILLALRILRYSRTLTITSLKKITLKICIEASKLTCTQNLFPTPLPAFRFPIQPPLLTYRLYSHMRAVVPFTRAAAISRLRNFTTFSRNSIPIWRPRDAILRSFPFARGKEGEGWRVTCGSFLPPPPSRVSEAYKLYPLTWK